MRASDAEMRARWSIDWTRRSDTLCMVIHNYDLLAVIGHLSAYQNQLTSSEYNIELAYIRPYAPWKHNLIDTLSAQLDARDHKSISSKCY